MHLDLQQCALRVDQRMTPAALDLFTAVVPTRSAYLSGLDRLAVADRGCGLNSPADCAAMALAQSLGHVLPGAVLAPLSVALKAAITRGHSCGSSRY
jgi:hypothetical protein